MELIPLRRVRLPETDRLVPYLRQIDANGWYSNYGPALKEFEARLANHFGCRPQDVVVVASATLAITLALAALPRRTGSKCMMPAFTFVATPAASVAAGLRPYFIDIDSRTWGVTPAAAEGALRQTKPRDVAAIVPVSVFGAPVDVGGWIDLQDRTGIPVVVDAAWCFDSLQPSRLPQCVSLHATKVFGTGEGGAIVCTDPDFVRTIRRLANFGLREDRVAITRGINAKMSEYGAAVGLAGLDAWPEQRERALELQRWYMEDLSRLRSFEMMPGLDGNWVTGTIAVASTDTAFESYRSYLDRALVEARPWWGVPCHTHPAFHRSGRADMSATDDLYRRLTNLPFYADMSRGDVRRVVGALAESEKPAP